jgi:hypothetical protein
VERVINAVSPGKACLPAGRQQPNADRRTASPTPAAPDNTDTTDSGGLTHPQTEKGLKQAAAQYFEDYYHHAVAGESADVAYRWLSQACQGKNNRTVFAAVVKADRLSLTVVGLKPQDLRLKTVEVVRFAVPVGQARFIIETDARPEFATRFNRNKPTHWTYENGGWRLTLDNCRPDATG